MITNLAVFELADEGDALVLTELHPGVTPADVQEQTGFELIVARDVRTTQPPSDEELRVLREEVDPLGVRRLDFEPAATRGDLIRALLAAERAAILPAGVPEPA